MYISNTWGAMSAELKDRLAERVLSFIPPGHTRGPARCEAKLDESGPTRSSPACSHTRPLLRTNIDPRSMNIDPLVLLRMYVYDESK